MATADLVFRYLDIGMMLLKYGWPFIILALLMFMKFKWGKYPIEAVILEKRGDNLIKTNDRVGKFDDLKDGGVIKYRLQKCRDTIPVFNYEWILHNNFVANTFLEKLVSIIRGNAGTVLLYRYGSKQYKPVKINERGEMVAQFEEIKDKRGNPIWVNIYHPMDPRKEMLSLDFEVIDWDNINFMVQEQRASTLRRQKSKEFWMGIAIPAMIIAGAILFAIFSFKFSADISREMRATQAPQPNTDPGSNSALLGGISDTITPGA